MELQLDYNRRTETFVLRARPANQCVAQIQGKPVPGVRDRRDTPGDPFDALIVGCYEGDKLKSVAKVRNGFVPHVRREVYRRLRGLEFLLICREQSECSSSGSTERDLSVSGCA